MPIIASLGDVDVDLILDVAAPPRPGDEVFARTARIRLGGSAVNTAVWLVRLGLPSRILARVGGDAFGDQASEALRQTGVDTSALTVDDELPTGLNVLLVTPDGERAMIGLRGANRSFAGSPGWAGDCHWLHLSGYALLEGRQREAALAALATAGEAGMGVSVDVPSGVARSLGPDLAGVLSTATIVSIGREPLEWIMPAADPVGALVDAGPDTVAVTAGDAPFSLVRQGDSVTLSPPRVEVADTTGAGDAFVAGLVAGRLWKLELGPTAVLAAALGAAATRLSGAGNEHPVPDLLGSVLDPDLWPDARPEWIRSVRAVLATQASR